MAASNKFDVSSTSPDRPLYTGQRGSHIAASLDRSGSFREGIENPILSSLPNMSRSSSSATQGDVMNFFSCVRFDPKLVALDHKSNRPMDYKRHVSAALGISPDESPSSYVKGKQLTSIVPEDIKRLRDGLHANFRRARDRAKMFSEALSRFNKDFPNINSKKRARSENFSTDRSSFTLSDRPVLGPNIGKVGIHGHAVTGSFEHDQQKLEERAKTAVPNKRTRTSLVDVKMDVRTNSLVRSSGTVDREKDILRLANNGTVHGEERIFPIVGDGWEKSKTKKKRSGIKPDGSSSITSAKPVNNFQETKQGMQQRLATDARSKLSNDSHSFRLGLPNGTAGAGKSDGISQQAGLGTRVSTPRNDTDSNSAVSDRRDRPLNSDKERMNFRAANKATVRDEFNSTSPNSSAKLNTSIRAPRSGSGVSASKMSPVVNRETVPNDWELSNCTTTTKPPAGVSTNNRKRAASARSSSPPVAPLWQPPHKSSRTARRTNFIPVVSSNADSPALDSVSDASGSDLGLGVAKRLSGGSPQQIRLKGDPSSSAAFSESEESGVAEMKPKEKGRKPDGIDQKAGQNVQKVSNMVPPTKKNKLASREERGDGVRRQGRTGRNFPATRSLTPMTSEKLGNIGTVKQLRSSRLGFEKSESKAGRPPTRKLSDRKAYTRQKHSAISASADFHGPEDGHAELLAAVKGLINSGRAITGQFWKQMEPFFGMIIEEDVAYWKQKINLESSGLMATPVSSNIDDCEAVTNGLGLMGCARDIGHDAQRGAGIVGEQSQLTKGDCKAIPLCQRLLSALISEEGCSGSENFNFDAYDTQFETNGELELNHLDSHPQANYNFTAHSACNGYRTTQKPGHHDTINDVVDIPSNGLEYDAMDMNERLLLELQSIGISPDPVPEISQTDDVAIFDDLTGFEEKYQRQVFKKKDLLEGLLKSASVTKECQEKDFEQRALDKLVVMAYEKYMACWGRNPSGGRNTSSKVAKQAALGFVKRTLERYHQFEDTGKSCFNEPLFKDMFFAASSQQSGMEAESAKPHASSVSLEARTGVLFNISLNKWSNLLFCILLCFL
ncbi:plant/F27B13-30 protein [Medicago truncatula]|uniref:Plant/F27B13-30 protein n=1 Tax=Medicago truncatula TaxID=3880 RepID=A0A072V6Q1_MEDTR|nr:plant/F27B13-30 protein [Medicago truncatula]